MTKNYTTFVPNCNKTKEIQKLKWQEGGLLETKKTPSSKSTPVSRYSKLTLIRIPLIQIPLIRIPLIRILLIRTLGKLSMRMRNSLLRILIIKNKGNFEYKEK